MDNNARTPLKFRCIKCGTIWKQHADKSWSLFDQYQKPEQCCDNSTDFLSVLEPYDKVSQGLDDFLALEHPLRELSNARTPGLAIECPENCSTRLRAKWLETELAAANERFEKHVKAVNDWTSELASYMALEGDGQFKPENLIAAAERSRQWAADMQSKLTAAESKLEAARAEQIERDTMIAMCAQLPDGFQWGHDAMEQFNFGKRRAAEAIRAQMDTTHKD